jgi:hypothetical protein
LSQKFFSKTETFFFQNFSNFLMFFSFLEEYKFLKTWNWTQIFKHNLKSWKFGSKFGLSVSFTILLVTRFSLWNVVSLWTGYGIGRKYKQIWVLVLVLDLNQNSGFGGTLATQPDGTLFFLIFTYLRGRSQWNSRDYASNVAICHFLKPETNKGDFRLYFELVEKSCRGLHHSEISKTNTKTLIYSI